MVTHVHKQVPTTNEDLRMRSERLCHLISLIEGETQTWATTYAGGVAAAESTPVSERYLYAVYWAVTTLTTVGYGDITPTNDNERAYALVSMLCSALVFGYVMRSIGSLLASTAG